MFTFDDLNTWADRYDETEYYAFLGNTQLPSGYTYNTLMCDFMPSREEFTLLMDVFLDYAYELNLSYYSFEFPANQSLPPELLHILEEEQFGLSINQLLTLNPKAFTPSRPARHDLEVKPIDESTYATYLAFNHHIYTEIAGNFANEKEKHFIHLYNAPYAIPLGAFLKGEMVGYLSLIESPHAVEIDDFSVADTHQRQGIGQAMQLWVVDYAKTKNKSIILAADADDSAREMYLKQGYEEQGFQISCSRKIPEAIRTDILAYQNGEVPHF